MGSVWGRFGVGLGSVWDRFGIGMGSVWDRFGVVLDFFISIKNFFSTTLDRSFNIEKYSD